VFAIANADECIGWLLLLRADLQRDDLFRSPMRFWMKSPPRDGVRAAALRSNTDIAYSSTRGRESRTRTSRAKLASDNRPRDQLGNHHEVDQMAALRGLR
jgi:hypothetical protein